MQRKEVKVGVSRIDQQFQPYLKLPQDNTPWQFTGGFLRQLLNFTTSLIPFGCYSCRGLPCYLGCNDFWHLLARALLYCKICSVWWWGLGWGCEGFTCSGYLVRMGKIKMWHAGKMFTGAQTPYAEMWSMKFTEVVKKWNRHLWRGVVKAARNDMSTGGVDLEGEWTILNILSGIL